jgi:hypothetical protein
VAGHYLGGPRGVFTACAVPIVLATGMIKALLWPAGVALAVLLAAPVHADPDTDPMRCRTSGYSTPSISTASALIPGQPPLEAGSFVLGQLGARTGLWPLGSVTRLQGDHIVRRHHEHPLTTARREPLEQLPRQPIRQFGRNAPTPDHPCAAPPARLSADRTDFATRVSPNRPCSASRSGRSRPPRGLSEGLAHKHQGRESGCAHSF